MVKILFKKGCLVLPLASLFLVACSNSNTEPTTPDPVVTTEITTDGDCTTTTTTTDGVVSVTYSGNCTIDITGTIQYQRVPLSTTTNGLDYDNIEDLPVRGATLQALDEDGEVIATTTTSNTGTYSVTVTKNSSVQIVVYAQTISTETAKWDFEVRDNTNNGSLYGMQGSLTDSDTSSDSIRNLIATTVWSGTSYTSRVSAPFAILDTTYDVIQKIVGVDPDVNMPAADIFWSEDNTTASGEVEDGDIGTSFYSNKQLYILGKEDSDTDEFDDHIIIHELGHYIEDNLSRSDSIGGDHSNGNVLDMRVALGEGFGNAFSGIVTDDPIYRDSSGSLQASGFEIDVDENTNFNPGWFSEGSVQSILYDLYDTELDGSDNVELGFSGIYSVLTSSDYINQSSQTSIFSFIDELKTQNPDDVTDIDTLVAGQTLDANYGIDTITDKFGTGETHSAELDSNLDVYKIMLANSTPEEVCSHIEAQEYNGLGTRQFVRLDISVAGTYTITANFVSTGSNISEAASDPDFVLYLNGDIAQSVNGLIAGFGGGTEASVETSTVNLQEDEYILEVYDYSNVDNDEDSLTGGTVCFNVTVTNS